MRRHGALGTASDLGMHDHACWIDDDDGDRRKAVVEYFADGLRAGQRLLYVGSHPVERLQDDLEGLNGVESLVADGTLHVLSLDDVEGAADARLSEVMGVAL